MSSVMDMVLGLINVQILLHQIVTLSPPSVLAVDYVSAVLLLCESSKQKFTYYFGNIKSVFL
jgi:hypothetical protein